MSQAAKAQEPSMEEILASIRRIIADDETAKPAPRAADPEPALSAIRPMPPVKAVPPPAPEPAPAPPSPEPEAMSQDDIDAMLAGFNAAEEEPPAPAKALADEPAEVLELTPAMEARSGPAHTGFHTIDPTTDVVFTDPAPEREPPMARAMADRLAAEPPPSYDAPLLSEEATAAVSSTFGSLAHTVLVQNGRTLDDLVREMLQPMLKMWLDDNLPTIVERLVRTEIERVSRGRS